MHSLVASYACYIVTTKRPTSRLISPESEHQLDLTYGCKRSSSLLVSDCRFQSFILFVYLEQVSQSA